MDRGATGRTDPPHTWSHRGATFAGPPTPGAPGCGGGGPAVPCALRPPPICPTTRPVDRLPLYTLREPFSPGPGALSAVSGPGAPVGPVLAVPCQTGPFPHTTSEVETGPGGGLGQDRTRFRAAAARGGRTGRIAPAIAIARAGSVARRGPAARAQRTAAEARAGPDAHAGQGRAPCARGGQGGVAASCAVWQSLSLSGVFRSWREDRRCRWLSLGGEGEFLQLGSLSIPRRKETPIDNPRN